MKRVKTADLIGAALDFAVSKADNPPGQDGWGWWERDEQGFLFDPLNECRYSPSTDWAQGGPIIDRLHIRTEWSALWSCWLAHDLRCAGLAFPGATRLIAAMRCFVASRLGDEVDVPEELL